jgi:hypothetical protein
MVKSKEVEEMADTATVILRKKSLFGSRFTFKILRAYVLKKLNVLVDGQKVDYLIGDKDLSFQVLPGQHTIQLKWSRWQSEEIKVDSLPSAKIILEWGSKPQYLKEYWFVLALFISAAILPFTAIILFTSFKIDIGNTLGTVVTTVGLMLFVTGIVLSRVFCCSRVPEVYYLKKIDGN